MKYTVTLKRIYQKGVISFELPADMGVQERIKGVFVKCQDFSNFVTTTFETPHKPRTTGKNSQNNHAWGHAMQIAQETGMEVYEVEYIAKVRAIKRGYPVTLRLGFPVPYSQKNISVEECAILIEEYHMIAAENGIILKEE